MSDCRAAAKDALAADGFDEGDPRDDASTLPATPPGLAGGAYLEHVRALVAACDDADARAEAAYQWLLRVRPTSGDEADRAQLDYDAAEDHLWHVEAELVALGLDRGDAAELLAAANDTAFSQEVPW